MATREQQRARFALEKVRSVAGRGDAEKYKTQLVKLPARLHTNGLGQTVGFYLSAGREKPEAQICLWLQHWLKAQVYVEGCFRPDSIELIDCISGARLPDGDAMDLDAKYRRASQEARALAPWLKRFAEAFLNG